MNSSCSQVVHFWVNYKFASGHMNILKVYFVLCLRRSKWDGMSWLSIRPQTGGLGRSGEKRDGYCRGSSLCLEPLGFLPQLGRCWIQPSFKDTWKLPSICPKKRGTTSPYSKISLKLSWLFKISLRGAWVAPLLASDSYHNTQLHHRSNAHHIHRSCPPSKGEINTRSWISGGSLRILLKQHPKILVEWMHERRDEGRHPICLHNNCGCRWVVSPLVYGERHSSQRQQMICLCSKT